MQLLNGALIPAKTLTVTVEQWRQYAYRLGISAGEERAKQSAFKRAVDVLNAARQIGIWEPMVWPI